METTEHEKNFLKKKKWFCPKAGLNLQELLDTYGYSQSKILKKSSEITLSEQQFRLAKINCKLALWAELDIKSENLLFNLNLLHDWQNL